MRAKDTTIKKESLRVLTGKVSEENVEKSAFECTLCGKVAAHKHALCRPRKIEGDDRCL